MRRNRDGDGVLDVGISRPRERRSCAVRAEGQVGIMALSHRDGLVAVFVAWGEVGGRESQGRIQLINPISHGNCSRLCFFFKKKRLANGSRYAHF